MREVEAEEGGGEEKRARKDEDGSKSGSSVKRYTRSWSTPTQKKERKKKVVEKWKTELFFFSLCQGLCFCLFIFILVVTVQLNMRLKHIICVFKRILIICLFKHIHMMCARMGTSLYVWRKKMKKHKWSKARERARTPALAARVGKVSALRQANQSFSSPPLLAVCLSLAKSTSWSSRSNYFHRLSPSPAITVEQGGRLHHGLHHVCKWCHSWRRWH